MAPLQTPRTAEQLISGFELAAMGDIGPGELVVEILALSDNWTAVTQKLPEYLAIGVELAWIVDPEARAVYAYRSMTDVREFTADDDLPGDDVLPGFTVKVATLFE